MPSFVDTNILIYAEDRDAKAKHDTARQLILGLWDERDGVVSVQVLQEFYVNATAAQINACGAFGCGCSAGVCSGGACP